MYWTPAYNTENFENLSSYERLVTCWLQRDSLFLFYQTRVNGKLLFRLCKSCMETKICQQAHIWRKSDPSLARGSQINLKKRLERVTRLSRCTEPGILKLFFSTIQKHKLGTFSQMM